jgi:hypothetical protein
MLRTDLRTRENDSVYGSYDDILSRIGSPPVWFDEHAVPRYCTFEPVRSPNIHIGEIALVEITCQNCGHVFHVAFSRLNMPSGTIAEAIRMKTLHYGDPPNVWCCSAGPSMNSIPRRVLEYWHRHDKRYVEDNRIINQAYFQWVRDPSLEVDLQVEGDGSFPWVGHPQTPE